jgi:hypothetical protein
VGRGSRDGAEPTVGLGLGSIQKGRTSGESLRRKMYTQANLMGKYIILTLNRKYQSVVTSFVFEKKCGFPRSVC